jgi:glycosyltransferase involved in cell wall biosynthesis
MIAYGYKLYRKIRDFLIRNDKYRGRVFFCGQMYYHTWYLSRELRKLKWCADVLNWDANPDSQKFYHGEDFKFNYYSRFSREKQMFFYLKALMFYDIFHFSNAYGMSFGSHVRDTFSLSKFPLYSEIRQIKKFGKKIVYTNNGCLDGVSQSSFHSWSGPEPVCDICPWQNNLSVCSDERNLAWGKIRNELADYQCTLGGNRKDYNDDPRVHEVPEFYCLDPDFWRPDLTIPPEHRLSYAPGTVMIYHAVGNFEMRTDSVTGRNLKSTHIYLPLIKRLKAEGFPVELFFAKNIPNKDVRYYQVQADIVVDMLTFGWFGANIREAMMLGKPAVCYLRPEWLESMRREIPDYVNELPVVSATPETIHDVLVDLVKHPEKRREIGRRSREFAVKWHSSQAGARRMDKIYMDLFKKK